MKRNFYVQQLHACNARAGTPARARTHKHTHAPTSQHTQKYAIFIAFPRQHCFDKRASVLRDITLPVLFKTA
jgi:hypothetical protein